MKDDFKDQPIEIDPFAENLAKQADPFAEDLIETIIEDPIEGVAVSEEWKHPETRVGAPIDDAQSARWQEHIFDNRRDETHLFDQNICIELARFAAPPGTQGRVSIIETALLIQPETGPPFNCSCDCPWAYDYLAGWPATGAVAFYLRLDGWPRQGFEPTPLYVPTVNQLPGKPHPALGEWHDARYDFGRRNNHVSLFVPEGQFLRLFVEWLIDGRNFNRVWGRLAGITQHYRFNPSAEIESRKWPAG